MLVEVTLHQLSLLESVDRARTAIVSAPAEQGVTGMGLLELAMNHAELAQRLQQIRRQQVVDHVQHQSQARW